MVFAFLILFLFLPLSIFSMNDTNQELIKAIQNHEVRKVECLIKNREILSSHETEELLLIAIQPYITDEVIQVGKRYSACVAIDSNPENFMKKALSIQKNCHIINIIKQYSGDFSAHIESVVQHINHVYKPEIVEKKYMIYTALPTFFGFFFSSLKQHIINELKTN